MQRTDHGTAPAPPSGVELGAPVFSIIMAAYNAADTIEMAISSARHQTFGDFELIVVDDGSSDGTAAILDRLAAEDSRLRVIHQENQGANATRNRAIGLARGELITFLDSDDLKLPTYLERAREAMRPADVGLAYSDSYVLDYAHRRVHRSTILEVHGRTDPPPGDTEELLSQLIESCFIPFTATTVRSSVLQAVGAFEPRLAGTDDWELWLRIVASGARAVRVPGTLAVMGRVEGQISGDREVMLKNLRVMFDLVGNELGLPEPVRLRALELSAKAEADAAASAAPPVPNTGIGAAARKRGESVTWVRSWRIRHPRAVAAAFPGLSRHPKDA